MTITTREAVRAAYAQAFAKNNDHSSALQEVAQALALPAETVAECVQEAV